MNRTAIFTAGFLVAFLIGPLLAADNPVWHDEARATLAAHVDTESMARLRMRRFGVLHESEGSEEGRRYRQISYVAEIECLAPCHWDFSLQRAENNTFKTQKPPRFPNHLGASLAQRIAEMKWHDQNPGMLIEREQRATIAGRLIFVLKDGRWSVALNRFGAHFGSNPWVLPDGKP